MSHACQQQTERSPFYSINYWTPAKKFSWILAKKTNMFTLDKLKFQEDHLQFATPDLPVNIP
jgi:hypothetical protein